MLLAANPNPAALHAGKLQEDPRYLFRIACCSVTFLYEETKGLGLGRTCLFERPVSRLHTGGDPAQPPTCNPNRVLPEIRGTFFWGAL